jgi:curli biogenesis system outer membrane secretion channel CsgG
MSSMMPYRVIRAGLLILLASSGALAAQPRGNLRYSIVVDKFENKTNSSHALGDEWSMLLTSKLHESGQFIVVAQTDMQLRALKEQLAAMSGTSAMGRKSAVRGQMTPAQLLIKGVITDFKEDAADQNGGVNLGNFKIGGGQKRTEIRANLQIIDASTGVIVAAKQIIGLSQKRGFSLRSNRGDNVNMGQDDNVQAALDKAISDAIPWIVAQLPSVRWRGSVMKVDKERIIINRGTREGVRVGDELIVGESEILRDPDTGEVAEELIHERARIKVIEVTERAAICSIVSGKMSQIVERMAVKYGNESS